MRSRLTIVAMTMTITLLSGCVSTPLQKEVASHVTTDLSTAGKHMQSIKNPGDAYFVESDEFWLGGSLITHKDTQKLPEIVNTPVVFIRQTPVTLQDIASYVRGITGLKVSVRNTANLFTVQTVTGAGPSAVVTPLPQGTMLVRFQGDVRGLLDYVTTRAGIGWGYDEEGITMFRDKTQVWYIASFPGTSSLTASVTNQSKTGQSGSGGGGGGTPGGAQNEGGQTTIMDSEINIMQSMEDTVNTMLSETGKMTLAPSIGALTVTDNPSVLATIDEYISSINNHLTQQVYIDVKVYSVDLTNSDSYGLDWNVVWESVNGVYGINTLIGADVSETANSMAISILDTTKTYGGSAAVISALAEQGDISIVTSGVVATLTNQPVPVQVATETTYLAEVSTELVSNVGSQTTLTPGTVTTGFTMTLLPVVLHNREVLLQYQINLSALRSLDQIRSGGVVIETPNIALRNFLQRVKMKSGQTLVMSGFEQTINRSNKRGVGDPSFWALGGSTNNEQTRTVLVVLITPRISS